MKTSAKRFDCVAMKRRAQVAMYRNTKGMDAEEFLAYLRRKTEACSFYEWWRAVSKADARHAGGVMVAHESAEAYGADRPRHGRSSTPGRRQAGCGKARRAGK